jgi:hypothetical protein
MIVECYELSSPDHYKGGKAHIEGQQCILGEEIEEFLAYVQAAVKRLNKGIVSGCEGSNDKQKKIINSVQKLL